MAQMITIRIISAHKGGPLPKQRVLVTLLYEKGERPPPNHNATLTLETDPNGNAHFTLPEPSPAHLAARVVIDWGHWNCACGVLAATQDVIQKGIVESAVHSFAAEQTPGEILFVVRPLSLWERILYPLVKG
jgi:hypothetical protein